MDVGHLILYTPVIILLACLIILFLPSDRKSFAGFVFIIAIITSIPAEKVLSGVLYGVLFFLLIFLRTLFNFI
ncbi:MAG TPA: hypothetical protein VNJ07_08475 [Chitinophagales bacterium]|nr:hypothetical protein [Chitinophagales bacterium]